jgi:signal transduction histidine kinase
MTSFKVLHFPSGWQYNLLLIVLTLCTLNNVDGQQRLNPVEFDSIYMRGTGYVGSDLSVARKCLSELNAYGEILNTVQKARVNYLRYLVWKNVNSINNTAETDPIRLPQDIRHPDTLVLVARKYLKRSMPDKAIPLLMEAMNKYSKDSDREIFCRINLCEAYREKQEYQKGIEILKEILADGNGVSDLNRAFAYNRQAALYNESGYGKQHTNDTVIKYSQLCIDLSTQIHSQANLALSQNELSFQYLRSKQYAKALQLSLDAVRNFKEIGEIFDAMNTLINLSDIYLALKEPAKAMQAMEEASNLCHIEESRNIFMRIYVQMAKIYAITGKFQEAYNLMAIGRLLQDDFYKDRINKQINEQSAKYNLFTKEQKLREERQNFEFHKKQTTFLLIILVVLIIAFILSVFFFRLKRKEFLKQKLMEAVVDTEAIERKRIARDLHDGLGPLLSAINHYFQAYIDAKDVEKNSIQEKTQQVISAAVDEVTRIAHNISPYILEKHGLFTALKNFISHLESSSKINVFLNVDSLKRFESKKELTVYRCLAELMTNTIKYANATAINIDITDIDKQIIIIYTDDGIGFNLNQVNSDGMGLNNIRKRVETFDGKIHMDSSPNQGVRVKIEIPVQYEKN